MKYNFFNKNIPLERESLMKIIDLATMPEERLTQRLLYAFQTRNFSRQDVEMLTVLLCERRCRIENEQRRYRLYKEDFPYVYVTSNNSYYNELSDLFGKLRSLFSPLKQILYKTCPADRPSQRECEKYSIEQRNTIDRSILVSSYEPDLFIDDLPDYVKGFIGELREYFSILEQCAIETKEVLEKVDSVRANGSLCIQLLRGYVVNCAKKHSDMWKAMGKVDISQFSESCLMYKDFKRSKDIQKFAVRHYHNNSVVEADGFSMLTYFDQTSNNEISEVEFALWGDNETHIFRIRFAIDNFDKLLPESINKSKVSSYIAAFLSFWANSNNDFKSLTEYFRSTYMGIHNVPSYSSLNNWKTKIRKSDFEDFIGNIECFVNNNLSSVNAGNGISIAVVPQPMLNIAQ